MIHAADPVFAVSVIVFDVLVILVAVSLVRGGWKVEIQAIDGAGRALSLKTEVEEELVFAACWEQVRWNGFVTWECEGLYLVQVDAFGVHTIGKVFERTVEGVALPEPATSPLPVSYVHVFVPGVWSFRSVIPQNGLGHVCVLDVGFQCFCPDPVVAHLLVRVQDEVVAFSSVDDDVVDLLGLDESSI